MSTSSQDVAKPYYQIVREVLASNIRSGTLPRGTRLFAASVADRLDISRPPARRALELLVEDGLISALDALGYVVGHLAPGESPNRQNLHALDLQVPSALTDSLGQYSWERIFEVVQTEAMDCMPFGAFQISESALGAHFKVSRTVVREVLSRLHGQGIVTKDRNSHWIIGPLSARALEEAHEVRRLLEPSALQAAAPLLDRAQLALARKDVDQALMQAGLLAQTQIDALEQALHIQALAPVANRRIGATVRLTQVSLVINRLFGTHVGVHDETDLLHEHRLVFDHLLIGDLDGAGLALRHHLDADHQRARARLKVLSIFKAPPVAPYLTRIH